MTVYESLGGLNFNLGEHVRSIECYVQYLTLSQASDSPYRPHHCILILLTLLHPTFLTPFYAAHPTSYGRIPLTLQPVLDALHTIAASQVQGHMHPIRASPPRRRLVTVPPITRSCSALACPTLPSASTPWHRSSCSRPWSSTRSLATLNTQRCACSTLDRSSASRGGSCECPVLPCVAAYIVIMFETCSASWARESTSSAYGYVGSMLGRK